MSSQLDIFSTPSEPIAAPPLAPLTWKTLLEKEKEEPYFKEILTFVEKERAAGKTIYPKNSDIFNSLAFTPFENVKVVILGQDPYHGPGQAHGLCFSVREGVPPPPSLINIFKEISQDLGVPLSKSGCLEKWAKQGVLLLNAVLTVEAGLPQSHANKGWERFTDKIVEILNDKCLGLVFLLWGSPAQKKGALIDRTKHTVLSAPHPSPLSANRGFFGCKHFSRTNEVLRELGLAEIDWSL